MGSFNCQVGLNNQNHLEKESHQGIVYLGWSVGVSMGELFNYITDMGRSSSLWVAPFPNAGVPELHKARDTELSINKEVVSIDVFIHFSLLLVVDVV